MTDDAPSHGTPDPQAQPTPPPPPAGIDPNRTVMRPNDPLPDSPGGPGVDNPDLPPPAPAPTGGPPHRPADAGLPTRAAMAGPAAAIVAVGTGLLGAAVLVSAIRSRWTDDGELDWSIYSVGLAATAGLLLISLLAAFATGRKVGGRARGEVVAWPGAAGILAVAAMIMVGQDSDEVWVLYLVGAVVLGLSVLGYLAARRAPFVVTAIIGLGMLYALAFDDLVGGGVREDQETVVHTAIAGAFVLAVTVVGWLLPTRVISGIAVGLFGLAYVVQTLVGLAFERVVSGLFAGMPMEMLTYDAEPPLDGMTELGGSMSVGSGFREEDVWWILGVALVLAVVWALVAALSDHDGFALLAVAMLALAIPAAVVALAAEHPTYLAAGLAGGGGVLLLGGVFLARSRGRKTAREVQDASYAG